MTDDHDGAPADGLARELTVEERRYVSAVRLALRGLPRAAKAALVRTVRQNLTDRPPTDSREDLLRALGPASAYAADLMRDAELADPGSISRPRRRHRARQVWVGLALAVLVAGAIAGTRWWVTWQPTFYQEVGGLCTGPDTGTCDADAFGHDDNALGSVATITCRAGTQITIIAGIGSSTPVPVTGADLPATGIGDMYVPDAAQPWPRGPDRAWPTKPTAWPVEIDSNADRIHLHLHLTLRCPTQFFSPGTSLLLDRFQVHYRAWWRDRTSTVILNEPLQIVMPGG